MPASPLPTPFRSLVDISGCCNVDIHTKKKQESEGERNYTKNGGDELRGGEDRRIVRESRVKKFCPLLPHKTQKLLN